MPSDRKRAESEKPRPPDALGKARLPWRVGEYNDLEDAHAILDNIGGLITFAELEYSQLIVAAVNAIPAEAVPAQAVTPARDSVWADRIDELREAIRSLAHGEHSGRKFANDILAKSYDWLAEAEAGERDPEATTPAPQWRKVRKKPVEVEVRDAIPGETIQTLEGALTASAGDLIIRGVQGECYPIKPDIFAAIYDERERGEQPDEAASGAECEQVASVSPAPTDDSKLDQSPPKPQPAAPAAFGSAMVIGDFTTPDGRVVRAGAAAQEPTPNKLIETLCGMSLVYPHHEWIMEAVNEIATLRQQLAEARRERDDAIAQEVRSSTALAREREAREKAEREIAHLRENYEK